MTDQEQGQVCGFEKEDGDTCTTDFGLCDCHGQCYTHSPCREEERTEARKRGAETTNAAKKDSKIRTVEDDSAPPPPQTAKDAQEWASWAVWAVSTGRIDARTAHEIGYVLRAFLKSRKTVELEEELQEFKRQVREKLDDRDWGPGAT